MKTSQTSLLLACGFALLAIPAIAKDESGESKFKAADTNNDGRITKQEHRQALEQKFSKMDTNRDGTISASEIEAGSALKRDQADMKKASKHAGADHLRMADANHDGLLTKAEYDASCESAFSDADRNADGFLSQGEFAEGHKNKKK